MSGKTVHNTYYFLTRDKTYKQFVVFTHVDYADRSTRVVQLDPGFDHRRFALAAGGEGGYKLRAYRFPNSSLSQSCLNEENELLPSPSANYSIQEQHIVSKDTYSMVSENETVLIGELVELPKTGPAGAK